MSARVSLASLDSGWAITVGGSNLTDEEVLGQVLDTVFSRHLQHSAEVDAENFCFAELSVVSERVSAQVSLGGGKC